MKTNEKMTWGYIIYLVERYFDSPLLVKRLKATSRPDGIVDLHAGLQRVHELQVGSHPPAMTILPMQFTSRTPQVVLIQS